MAVLSNAVPQNAVASVLGYNLGVKDFSEVSSNLPQRIALFTTVGADKVSGFSGYDTAYTVNSVKQYLDKFGVSPGYYALRILKPLSGGGVGTVPIDVFAIEDDGAAAASAGDITPSGTATANATHYVTFNGRRTIDGRQAAFSVETGDVVADIVTKITAAIDGMLYAPVDATDSTTTVDVEVRWKGASGDEVTIAIETDDNDAGITYAFTQPTGGSGAISYSDSLANFGEVWYTQVLNTFGSGHFTELASFNGEPDPDTGGSGRWQSLNVKPFVAFTGTNESTIATLKALASTRKSDLTNCVIPAPNSPSLSWEIAAGCMVRTAVILNSTPHRDFINKSLFDVVAPTGGTAGDMNDYLNRDDLVKNGISTVVYNESEGYLIKDLITMRRPDDQSPTAIDFKYVKDIAGIDFNVKYQYRLLEVRELEGKTLANDEDTVNVTEVIKPKDWKGLLYTLFESLSKLAIIADPEFSQDSLQCQISATNPNRFETTFNYKRTGIARISSSDVFAGFNFGEL